MSVWSESIHCIGGDHTDASFFDEVDDGFQLPTIGSRVVHLRVYHPLPILLNLFIYPPTPPHPPHNKKKRKKYWDRKEVHKIKTIKISELELKFTETQKETLKKRGAEYFKRLGFRFKARALTGRCCRSGCGEGGGGSRRHTTERRKERDGAPAAVAAEVAQPPAIASDSIIIIISSGQQAGMEHAGSRVGFCLTNRAPPWLEQKPESRSV